LSTSENSLFSEVVRPPCEFERGDGDEADRDDGEENDEVDRNGVGAGRV